VILSSFFASVSHRHQRICRLATLIASLRPYYRDLSDAAFVQILPRALSGGATWAHDTVYDTVAPPAS